jgi:hypothetical protein
LFNVPTFQHFNTLGFLSEALSIECRNSDNRLFRISKPSGTGTATVTTTFVFLFLNLLLSVSVLCVILSLSYSQFHSLLSTPTHTHTYTHIHTHTGEGNMNDEEETVEMRIGEILNEFRQEVDNTTDGDDDKDEDQVRMSEVSFKLYFLTSMKGNVDSEIKSNVRNSLLRTCVINSVLDNLRIEVQSPKAIMDIDAFSSFSPHARTVLVCLPTGSRKFIQRFSQHWDFKIMNAWDVCIELPTMLPFRMRPTQSAEQGVGGGGGCVGVEGSTPDKSHAEGHILNQKVVLSDVLSVTSGFFKGHGIFVPSLVVTERSSTSTPSSRSVTYNTLEIICGVSWTLSTRNSGEEDGIMIQGQVSVLRECVFLSACSATKRITVFLLVRSTPSVQYKENMMKKNKKRVFCNMSTSEVESSVSAQEESMSATAQKHLARLAGRPVIAICFPLDKWNEVTSVFSDPVCVGQPALILRRADTTYPTSNSYQRGVSSLVTGRLSW